MRKVNEVGLSSAAVYLLINIIFWLYGTAHGGLYGLIIFLPLLHWIKLMQIFSLDFFEFSKFYMILTYIIFNLLNLAIVYFLSTKIAKFLVKK